MEIAKRARSRVIQLVFAAVLVLALVMGLRTQETSAAKYVAVNCSSLYASALWAGDQYLAADRRGDSASADFWWSVYNSLELSYARNCMGDMAS